MDLGMNSQAQTKMTIDELNLYLSNLFVLYAKLHNFHWNVIGYNFFEMHERLGELYEYVGEQIDLIAERILQLDGKPVASLCEAIKISNIEEVPSINYSSEYIAKSVVDDFIKVVKQLRNLSEIVSDNKDEVTLGLIVEALSTYEKNIWMFRAFLTQPQMPFISR